MNASVKILFHVTTLANVSTRLRVSLFSIPKPNTGASINSTDSATFLSKTVTKTSINNAMELLSQ